MNFMMTTQQLASIAPLASPLPPPPEGDVLTESQWITLMAIGDAIIPAIEVSSELSHNALALQPAEYTTITGNLQGTLPADTDENLVREYLAENPSSVAGVKEQLHRILSSYISPGARKGISLILSVLE